MGAYPDMINSGEDYGDLQRLSFEALVNQYFSNFGWPDYFDTLLTTETRKAVKNASVILSLYPVYFSKMQAHLGSVEPATMEAYIAWNIIKAYIPYIAYSDDLKSIWRALGRLNQPVAQCLQTTESFFVEYFSLLFIRKNFGSVQKDYAKEMMEFIRTAMAVKFKQLEWLDPKTRDAAIEKVLILF